MSEDRTISQQNACRKACEGTLKNKAKDVPKDGNVGKYGQVTCETNPMFYDYAFRITMDTHGMRDLA